jgi:hypothetical protein
MAINSVFIDIDDTLNSFTMRCLRYFGCNVGDFDFDRFPHEYQFDIVAACNHLLGTSYNIPEFWNAVPRRLWYTCPKSQEFDLIMAWAQNFVPKDNIYLLTAPTKDPECLAGKLDWIVDNMPTWIHRQYFVTPRKFMLAAPGRLFIDDSDHNINKWNDPGTDQKGGIGVLVPRPWNHMHAVDNAYEHLQTQFKAIYEQQSTL